MKIFNIWISSPQHGRSSSTPAPYNPLVSRLICVYPSTDVRALSPVTRTMFTGFNILPCFDITENFLIAVLVAIPCYNDQTKS